MTIVSTSLPLLVVRRLVSVVCAARLLCGVPLAGCDECIQCVVCADGIVSPDARPARRTDALVGLPGFEPGLCGV